MPIGSDAMTTINTIEDLVQVLDDNPRWLEAIRARLLTREVLEMPQTLASLTERMDRFERRMGEFEARTDRRFDRLEAKVQSITDDVGVLKGAHARNIAIEDAASIARDMGLRLTRTLTRGDIVDLEDAADTSGIPANELRSFRLADLIMEARAGEGEACYVAVEVSFTVNGRDTSRAIRNADFLSRFTGRRSYPAVVGSHRDERVRDAIESGEVFWYRLDSHQLDAE